VAECTLIIAQVLEHLISSASQQMQDKSTPPGGQPNKHARKKLILNNYEFNFFISIKNLYGY
jgi:hypothetical protein